MDGGLVVERCQDISRLSGAMDFNWSISAVEDLWSTLRNENDWFLQCDLKEADKYMVETNMEIKIWFLLSYQSSILRFIDLSGHFEVFTHITQCLLD